MEELSDTGEEYTDLWSFDLATKTWDTLKKSGAPPSKRSGYCMALHKRRLIVFGGVHDEDTPDGEGLLSEFYNDLHAYNLDAGKWNTLTVNAAKGGNKAKQLKSVAEEDSSPKKGGKVDDTGDDLLLEGGGRRRNRNRKGGGDDEDDEDVVAAKAEAAKPAAEASTAAEEAASAASSEPCARMKSSAALRGNTLYIYGGIVEPEEASELTLSDFWSVDLAKLDGWNCLYEGEAVEKTIVREEESDEEDDDDDDDDSDDSESEESSEEEDDDEEEEGGASAPAAVEVS